MGIATRWQQAEDLYPLSTHDSSPVSHKVGSCHHLDRWHGGCGTLTGNSRLRHFRYLRILVISASNQECRTENDKARS